MSNNADNKQNYFTHSPSAGENLFPYLSARSLSDFCLNQLNNLAVDINEFLSLFNTLGFYSRDGNSFPALDKAWSEQELLVISSRISWLIKSLLATHSNLTNLGRYGIDVCLLSDGEACPSSDIGNSTGNERSSD